MFYEYYKKDSCKPLLNVPYSGTFNKQCANFSKLVMKVVNREILSDFGCKHADAASSISAWLNEVSEVQWTKPTDIKSRFPSMSIISATRFIFNIKGNAYRLDVKINFPTQTVLIKRMGTHAEYSKWEF